MKVLATAFAACLAVSCASARPGLAGDWSGTWTRQGQTLPVTVTFARSDAGWSGSFDSDALQVAGIPFADVGNVGGKVHWLLKGDESTAAFDGMLRGDGIDGVFVEGGATGRFELHRIAARASDVVSREVTFADKDVTLAGTLLLPRTPGPHAGIVFLHGSGSEGRWANRWLAEAFAHAGIAALIYDKRGVGGSGGDWKTVGFDALAADAIAAVGFLRSQVDIEPTHVGIYGHSQGGTLAPMVAVGDGHLGFVIASAAGGIAPADVESYSVGNNIGLSQLPVPEQKDAKAYVEALIDVAYRGNDRASLDALATKFKDRPWYFDPPPPGNTYWDLSRRIAAFDPAHWWSQVHAPVLLVYGAHDERVPPEASVEAIQAALGSGGNAHVTVRLYPDADHTFTIVDPARKGGWPMHVQDYAETLTAWVRAQVRTVD